MKTERILGISWLTLFSFILVLWWWQFVEQSHQDWHFRAYASPLLLFGSIAGFFLFRGARWARMAVGIMTLLMAMLVIQEIWQMGFWPKFDGYIGIFGVASAVILLTPRRRAGVS